MSEARIGRIVAAALHASLAAHLPFRVEFYEHWLQPPRLRTGSVGKASFLAVLSFLRQEDDMYSTIVRDAGRLAADWVFDDAPPWWRLRWRWMRRARKPRAALWLAQRLVAESSSETKSRVRWRQHQGQLVLRDSTFCVVRANASAPLCGFYAAAVERFCERLAIAATVTHEGCRAMGAETCSISLTTGGQLSPANAPDSRTRAGAIV
jgi:hypothetical protein